MIITAIAILLSVVWLYVAASYLNGSIGFDNLLLILPQELALTLFAVLAPLLLIWLFVHTRNTASYLAEMKKETHELGLQISRLRDALATLAEDGISTWLNEGSTQRISENSVPAVDPQLNEPASVQAMPQPQEQLSDPVPAASVQASTEPAGAPEVEAPEEIALPIEEKPEADALDAGFKLPEDASKPASLPDSLTGGGFSLSGNASPEAEAVISEVTRHIDSQPVPDPRPIDVGPDRPKRRLFGRKKVEDSANGKQPPSVASGDVDSIDGGQLSPDQYMRFETRLRNELNTIAMDFASLVSEPEAYDMAFKQFNAGNEDAFFDLVAHDLENRASFGSAPLGELPGEGSLDRFCEKFERLLVIAADADRSGMSKQRLDRSGMSRVVRAIARI